MLQQAEFTSETAAASVFQVTDLDSDRELSARMRASRFSAYIFNNTSLEGDGVHRQHIRWPLLDSGQSVMTVHIGKDSERSKAFRRQRDFVCGEDVEWEGGIRGSKRREVTDKREDLEILDQQQHFSGESDLTAEHSVIYMAAESNSTRTTSSLEEDGCQLKLQCTAPAICNRYGDHHHEEEDDDNDDSKLPYNERNNVSCFNEALNARQTSTREDQHDEDWLELRLGSKFSATVSSSPASLCTLQLLPQKPDCASMKEREIKKLSTSDTRQTNTEQEELKLNSQAKLPFIHNYNDRASATVQNVRESQEHLAHQLSYSTFLQPSPTMVTTIPTPPSENIGQYIAGPLAQYGGASEIYPKFSLMCHQHQQPLLRQILPRTSVTTHEQISHLLSPLCHSSQAASSISRSPMGVRHESWQHLVSASPTVLQPASFQDLIASSFLKDDNGKCATIDSSLLTPQHPLNKAVDDNWPPRLHRQNQGATCTDDQFPLNMMPMEFDPFHTRPGSRSMTSWLSQTLAAAAAGPESPESSTPTLVKQRNERSHSKAGATRLLFKRITRSPLSIPGFWFALQPAETQSYDPELPPSVPKSYIRIKDGNVPISAVKKYLEAKLGLSSESQVELTCRGKCMAENVSLKNVRDEIWLPPDFAEKETLSFRSEDSSNIPKECVMILTYQISRS